MKERIEVSPEMVTFVGPGAADPFGWPDRAIALLFRHDASTATVELVPCPTAGQIASAPLALLVAHDACERLFAHRADAAARWHLPNDLATIALAIRDGTSSPAGTTLRLAKSIELLCGVFACLSAGTLICADVDALLPAGDAARIVAARRMIDEQWREPLTLDGVARACGVNRAKLTRGFRRMFGCSVGDAILDRRLTGARDLLLATPLPVSSIGYQCGYLSNASFTRAFTRRFGLAPTQLRQHRLAA